MRIIGLTGPKGSGKDTSFEILRDAKRVDGKISFAGPLKTVCGQVFNLHFNLLNDAVLKERPLREPILLTAKHIRRIIQLCEEYVPSVMKDGRLLYRSNAVSMVGLEGRVFKTPREVLQIVGTELIRDRVYKNWHKDAAFSDKALAKLKKDGTYAVTDLRFSDEHEYLRDRYSKTYKAFYVDRPESSKALDEAVASGKAHSSETETQKLREMLKDSVIDNSGGLKQLHAVLSTLDLGSEGAREGAGKASRFRYAQKETEEVVSGAAQEEPAVKVPSVLPESRPEPLKE